MRRFMGEAFDPLTALRRVAVPFLAVYGGRDVLVPAWRSAAETGEAVAAADTSDATVVVFPTGDHRIGEAGEFVPGYLDLLGDWAARRLSMG